MCTCVYIYIYVYTNRHIHIYICIYTYIYIYRERERDIIYHTYQIYHIDHTYHIWHVNGERFTKSAYVCTCACSSLSPKAGSLASKWECVGLCTSCMWSSVCVEAGLLEKASGLKMPSPRLNTMLGLALSCTCVFMPLSLTLCTSGNGVLSELCTSCMKCWMWVALASLASFEEMRITSENLCEATARLGSGSEYHGLRLAQPSFLDKKGSRRDNSKANKIGI